MEVDAKINGKIVVASYESLLMMKVQEKRTFVLHNGIPYM